MYVCIYKQQGTACLNCGLFNNNLIVALLLCAGNHLFFIGKVHQYKKKSNIYFFWHKT